MADDGRMRAVWFLATLLVGLVGVPSIGSAQTTLNGGQLTSDTTWNQAGSPYILKGDLTVPSGKKLTIEKGVAVRARSSDFIGSGRDANRVELRIAGELEVAGTAGDPVRFVGTTNSHGHWWGIIVKAGASKVTIDQARVRDAENGLWIEDGQNVVVRRSHFFENDGDGIDVRAGSPTLDAVVVRSNLDDGLDFKQSAGAKVTNAIIRSNNSDGVFIDCDNSQQSSITIHSSVVYKNDLNGLQSDCERSAKTVTVRNTVIAQNSDYAVERERNNQLSFSVEYSDVWSNGNDYYGNVSTSNNLSARPLFQNPPGDLHLQSTSLLIDAGTNKGAPDHDFDWRKRPFDGDASGSAEYDIGAYEFARGTVCGDGTVDSGETCDDGAANGEYGKCNTSCSGPGPRCGDGMINGPEECDDGNTTSGDGCSATCMNESGGDVGPADTGPGGDAGDTWSADAGDVGPSDTGPTDTTGDTDGSPDTGESEDTGGPADDTGGLEDTGGSDTAAADADGGDTGSDDPGSDGCACSAPGGGVPGGLGALLLVLAAVGLRRWRRR